MSTADLIDRIDEVTAAGCAHCGGPLGGSPSEDFCRESCAREWNAGQAPCRLRSGHAITRPYAWSLIRSGRGSRLSDETQAMLAGELRAAMAPMQEAMTQFVEAARSAFASITETLHRAGLRPSVNEIRESPADRALRLRQSRNTGPQVHADPRRNRTGR